MMDFGDDVIRQLFDEPYWAPEHDNYKPSVVTGIKIAVLLVFLMIACL